MKNDCQKECEKTKKYLSDIKKNGKHWLINE